MDFNNFKLATFSNCTLSSFYGPVFQLAILLNYHLSNYNRNKKAYV